MSHARCPHRARRSAALTGGAESKWAAEKLVLAVADCGLPTVIYRPWVFLGQTETGA